MKVDGLLKLNNRAWQVDWRRAKEKQKKKKKKRKKLKGKRSEVKKRSIRSAWQVYWRKVKEKKKQIIKIRKGKRNDAKKGSIIQNFLRVNEYNELKVKVD